MNKQPESRAGVGAASAVALAVGFPRKVANNFNTLAAVAKGEPDWPQAMRCSPELQRCPRYLLLCDNM